MKKYTCIIAIVLLIIINLIRNDINSVIFNLGLLLVYVIIILYNNYRKGK